MDFTPTVWNNDGPPAINAPRLNNIEEAIVALFAEQRLQYGPSRRAIRPFGKVATSLASGHGWAKIGGTATVDVNSATSGYLSTQGVKITTLGDSSNNEAGRGTISPALNVQGKQVTVYVRIDNPANLNFLSLYLGDLNYANYAAFTIQGSPITGALFGRQKANEWIGLTFNPADIVVQGGTFNPAAVTQMKVRARDDGAGKPVVVEVGGIEVRDKAPAFPQGVVSITIDDVYSSWWTTFRPRMSERGFRGTAYLIIDRIGAAGGMPLSQLKSMQDDYGWEMGGHAYTTQTHTVDYPALTAQGKDDDLYKMKEYMVRNGLYGDTFAYPHGSFDIATVENLKKYYSAARTTVGNGRELPPPQHPYKLKQLALDRSVSVATMTAAIDSAYANGEWLIFMGHTIQDGGGATTLNAADLVTVLDYIVTKGIPVRTVEEVISTR